MRWLSNWKNKLKKLVGIPPKNIDVVFGFRLCGVNYYTVRDIFQLPIIRLLDVAHILNNIHGKTDDSVFDAFINKTEAFVNGDIGVIEMQKILTEVKTSRIPAITQYLRLTAALYFAEGEDPTEYNPARTIAALRNCPMTYYYYNLPLLDFLYPDIDILLRDAESFPQLGERLGKTLGIDLSELVGEVEKWKK